MLDTHAWIWFFNRHPRAAGLVSLLPADTRLAISVITLWEAGMLAEKGRVQFHPDLDTRIREMLTRHLCDILPLAPEAALAATRLPDFDGDPADRLIVATAIHHGVSLVPADGKILDWAAAHPGQLSVLAF